MDVKTTHVRHMKDKDEFLVYVDMFLFLIILAFVCNANVMAETCPVCCACSEYHNQTFLSCSCLPKIIPYDTTHVNSQVSTHTRLRFTHPSWRSLRFLSLLGDSKTEPISLGFLYPDYFATGETFLGVPNLEELKISNFGQLDHIPIGTFSHLHQLKVLDLSNNIRLRLGGLTSLITDLQHVPVEKLNLSRTNNYNQGSLLAVLDMKLFMKVENLTLRNVDLSWIGRVFMDFSNVFESPRFPNLEVLNLSNSLLTYSLFLPEDFALGRMDVMFPELKHLVYERRSAGIFVPDRPICREDIPESQYEMACTNQPTDIYLPPKLESADFDNSALAREYCVELLAPHVLCIAEGNHLNYFSMTNSGITGWNIIIWGLSLFRVLDLRYNRIGYIAESSMRYFPILERLLLGSNNLWKYQYNSAFGKFLIYSTDLRKIDLSSNNLSWIPQNLFNNNHKLEVIDLAGNYLNSISFKLNHLSELKVLNLSGNVISVIPEPTMNYINERSMQSVAFIDMTDNRITCSCDSKTYIGVLTDISASLINYDKYQCFYNGQVENLRSIHVDTLTEDCVLGILSIVLPVVCCVAFLAILLIILFIQRVNMIKLYVFCRFWRYRKRLVDVEDRVFLAYSHHDSDLVLSRIYPELNTKLQQLLGTQNDVLYINDKDFALPGLIDEEIVTAVSSCKCTIALVSKFFLKSNWTHLELSYSWMRKRPIILVFLEVIKESELRGILKYLYNKNVRLVWPINKSDEELFWTNLLRGVSKTLKLVGGKEFLEDGV